MGKFILNVLLSSIILSLGIFGILFDYNTAFLLEVIAYGGSLLLFMYAYIIKNERVQAIGLGLLNYMNYLYFMMTASLIAFLFSIDFYQFFVEGNAETDMSIYLAISVATELIIFITIMLINYRRELAQSIKYAFHDGFIQLVLKIIAYFFIMMAATYALSELGALIFGEAVPLNEAGLDEIEQGISSNMIGMISFTVMVVIGAPIIEEFTYRFLLMGQVLLKLKWLPKFGSVIIASIIFAAIHAAGSNDIVIFARDMMQYLGISFVISYAYYKEKTILIPVVLHFANNLLASLGSM